MKKIILFSAIIATTLSGCLGDLNLDPDQSMRYPGNWAAPLIHTRLNLGNLVDKDSLVTSDPDGLIHIIYREDSLFSQSVFEYTKVPEQDPVNVDFAVGNPTINVNTNLGTFGGAKMKVVTVSSGKLNWQTSTASATTIEVYVKLLNTLLNGQVAVFNIQAAPGQSSGVIDIAGLNFDLTQGNPAYNNLGFEIGLINAGGAPNGTQVDLTLQFEDLAIGQALGYFGNRKIVLPSGVIPTNLSILSNISGGLYLANPKIKLFTRSNIGLQLNLSPDIVGVSESGKSVDLALQPFFFTGSSVLGTYHTDTFEINTTNSQIDEFIANVPANLIYSGDVVINPNGETTNDNFVTNNGEVVVGLEVDLPLELKTKNLTIEQTIYDLDFGVEDGDVAFVEQLSLGFRVENGFPLQADLYFYFQDSTGAILDSAFIALFDAAQVDALGNVTVPAKGDRYLDFDNTEIKNILKSDDIRIKVVLNTINGGTQIVRLITDYYIDFILGIKVKMNYKL